MGMKRVVSGHVRCGGVSHGREYRTAGAPTLYPYPDICLRCSTISGARYSGVPQNVVALSAGVRMSLASPKSVSLQLPISSRRMFSGCVAQ